MTDASLSAMAKLRAVVAAQVAGGHEDWQHLDSPTLTMYGPGYVKAFSVDGASLRNHVLEILLDPAGIFAAFEDDPVRVEYRTDSGEDAIWRTEERHEYVARMILDAWMAKPEGDAEGAIDTAFNLLSS